MTFQVGAYKKHSGISLINGNAFCRYTWARSSHYQNIYLSNYNCYVHMIYYQYNYSQTI
jgi:hypothetical protein